MNDSQGSPSSRRAARAAAYAAVALLVVLGVRAWLRRSDGLGAEPEALLDAARPNPIPWEPAAGHPMEPEALKADRAAAAPAPHLTNEQLHAALEREKARMGIKQIVAPAPAGAPASPPAISNPTPALLAQSTAAPAAAAPGVIVHSEAERAALWSARLMAADPPSVDYARQQLVVVFAQSPRYGLEVAAVQTFPDRVIVQYREPEIPEDAVRQTQAPAYQFRVLPLSDKPVIFQKLP